MGLVLVFSNFCCDFPQFNHEYAVLKHYHYYYYGSTAHLLSLCSFFSFLIPHEEMHTNIYASSGIQTHAPSVYEKAKIVHDLDRTDTHTHERTKCSYKLKNNSN
jgi:hypothetical protein